MGKSTHFSGQPLYGQVINLLDKSKIFQISRENGGERYTKRFNVWVHLVVMLYAVIMRFDSLREITASLLGEARKLNHLGLTFKIGRSTLADANKRRPEHIFEENYRQLYGRYSDFQGCRKASQDWEEEGRDQGAYGHPCQRGSAIRHKVHVRSHQRLLHAQTGDSKQGGYNGDGPRIHRLREVRATPSGADAF